MTICVRERSKRLANQPVGVVERLAAHSASSRPMTPMIVASAMRPLRHTYIQKPMKIPSGIVMAMVKVPQTAVGQGVDDVDAEARQRDDRG